MKPLAVLWVLICCHFPARAAEQPPPNVPPGVTDAARDAEEFHDPFATKAENRKGQAKVSDPLQPVNKAFFKFNDRLYFWVLQPVARGYNKVAPEPFRQSAKRFFVNLRYPIRAVNNLLQGKFKGVGSETARFVINSTVGIGGLFDPANDEWKFRPYPEDLDQTLGFYRVPTGIYLHWPILGPSSVRGTAGTFGDSFLNSFNYVDGAAVIYGTRVYDTVNSTSLRLGEYERFKEAAFDPYTALRDAYFENRRSLVNQ